LFYAAGGPIAERRSGPYNRHHDSPTPSPAAADTWEDGRMPKVKFVNEKQEIEVPAGANLRKEALKAGVQVHPGFASVVNCLGNGLCGTCRVLVKSGMENLNKRTLIEKLNLNLHPITSFAYIGHEDEMRLACQVTVNGDCSVETKPELNLSGENFWQKPYPNK
jgi:ferredoxin